MSIHDLGDEVPWDESIWLVDQILTDPSAHLTAALLGWEHPLSHEGITLAGIYDLTIAAAGFKKPGPKPWPVPWPKAGTKRTGRTTLPPDEAKRLLARLAGRE